MRLAWQSVAAELAKTSATSGRKVTTHRLDVSDPAADRGVCESGGHRGASLAQHRHQQCRRGACSAQFSEIDQAQFEWLMNINFWGVVHGTRAFLPQLG